MTMECVPTHYLWAFVHVSWLGSSCSHIWVQFLSYLGSLPYHIRFQLPKASMVLYGVGGLVIPTFFNVFFAVTFQWVPSRSRSTSFGPNLCRQLLVAT